MSTEQFKQQMIDIVPNLRAFARSLCGNADWANDLAQETLIKAWTKRDTFEPGTNFKAWTFTILRNHFYNEIRKRKKMSLVNDETAVERISVPEVQSGKLHLQDLTTALNELSADQREALILVTVDGFSYEEAAQICSCAVGTIKSRIARARRELEQRLGSDNQVEVLKENHYSL